MILDIKNISLMSLNIIYMSYITYSPNEIVYVKGIGYATLINCGARNSISQKVQAVPEKKESIYFDPDLFNSDADSNNSKKSQAKSDDEKAQKKLTEFITQKNSQQLADKPLAENRQKKQQNEQTNIVQARLQGGTAVVYTSQKNLTKSIFIIVKSFLITRKDQIIIEIQISKTIDTLRKLIFQQMGQPMNNYYNIKLFTTNPTMLELTTNSKTISQCQIKDYAKLILTADYAFTFRPLPTVVHTKYKISINNHTLSSTKPVEQPKKADQKAAIPLPPPPPPIDIKNNQPKAQQTKPQQKKAQQIKVEQKKAEQKVEIKQEVVAQQKQQPVVVAQVKPQAKVQQPKKPQQPKKQIPQQLQQQKSSPSQFNPFNSKCSIQFSTGKRYWQIKIEKLPLDQDDLLIGVCIQSETKQLNACWNCDYVWAYQIITGKKINIERDTETNLCEEETQPYGYAIRQNDTVGVLLSFKGRKASLSFYKNSISCGEAFLIQLDSLKGEKRNLVPFVNIGGEAQITLDSKALPPLDSYRLK